MKKKIMRIALCISIFGANMLFAQDTNLVTTRGNQLTREYLRPSLTSVYFYDGSVHTENIASSLKEIQSEQFDLNVIQKNVFRLEVASEEELQVQIENALNAMKLGNQIMKNWFPEFDYKEKAFTYRILEERGKYAATDNDVLMAKASSRNDVINMLGEKLIDRSYVKVYYLYQDAKTPKKVNVRAFVYKLDYNKEVAAVFYENFTRPDAIETGNFPIKYLVEAKTSTYVEPDKEGKVDYMSKASIIYESVYTKTAKLVADFKVQTTIVETAPVRAKIGSKEGLKIDDRYDIMELSVDGEGKEVARRKGVVRVSYVADDQSLATGESTDLSKFNKYIGGGSQKGNTLLQHPEFGFGVSAMATTNAYGAMLEYRTKIKPGFMAFLKYDVLSEDTNFSRAGLGVYQEKYFARNFFFGFGVGGGLASYSEDGDSEDDTTKTYFGEGFGRFGILFGPTVQLFAQAGYSYYFNGYADYLNDEMKPIGLGLGLKISF